MIKSLFGGIFCFVEEYFRFPFERVNIDMIEEEKNIEQWNVVFDILSKVFIAANDTLYNDNRWKELNDFLNYKGKYLTYKFSFDDQAWILENFKFVITKDHPLPQKMEETISKLKAQDNPNLREIQRIVNDSKFSEREKLILVLSIIEPYIRFEVQKLPQYQKQGKISKPGKSIKSDVTSLLNRDHQLDDTYYLFDFAWIVCIIFRDTYDRTKLLDRHLPYRNFIFHTGILDYSKDEIHYCYTLLITYVYILHEITLKLKECIVA